MNLLGFCLGTASLNCSMKAKGSPVTTTTLVGIKPLKVIEQVNVLFALDRDIRRTIHRVALFYMYCQIGQIDYFGTNTTLRYLRLFQSPY